MMTADYYSSLSIFNSAYMTVTIKCILYYNNDVFEQPCHKVVYMLVVRDARIRVRLYYVIIFV